MLPAGVGGRWEDPRRSAGKGDTPAVSPTDKEEASFGVTDTGGFVGVFDDERTGFSTEEPADDGGTDEDFLFLSA